MSTEQRTNLKFLVWLGKTLSEALGMLQQVYGDETMSWSRVCEWYKRFKEGREDIKDDPRSGRPSTSRTEANVERVRQMVPSDRQLTVRLIANELGMNRNSVWKIITEDLGMRKVCAKMVPKLLNDDQKDRRMQVCQEGTICSCNLKYFFYDIYNYILRYDFIDRKDAQMALIWWHKKTKVVHLTIHWVHCVLSGI